MDELFKVQFYFANRSVVQYILLYYHTRDRTQIIVQDLISVRSLVIDLAQLTCQKTFDCRNAILRPSATLLGTSYNQIVVAVLLSDAIFERTLR